MDLFLLVLFVLAFVVLLDVLLGAGAVASALRAAARTLRRRHPHVADRLGLGKEICDSPTLNDPAGMLVGRIAVLEQPIVAGRGRLAIDGTTWPAQGPDLPMGARVRVTGNQGMVLVVEPAVA